MKKTMTKIKLLPINKRLKQLIKEFGEVWNIIEHRESVQCFNNEGYLVESLSSEHRRWCRKEEVDGTLV